MFEINIYIDECVTVLDIVQLHGIIAKYTDNGSCFLMVYNLDSDKFYVSNSLNSDIDEFSREFCCRIQNVIINKVSELTTTYEKMSWVKRLFHGGKISNQLKKCYQMRENITSGRIYCASISQIK